MSSAPSFEGACFASTIIWFFAILSPVIKKAGTRGWSSTEKVFIALFSDISYWHKESPYARTSSKEVQLTAESVPILARPLIKRQHQY